MNKHEIGITNRRIAIEYLNNLFKRLSAVDIADGELNPYRVDWVFAVECWGNVKNENDRLRAERDKFWDDAMELESVKCELRGCKLERDKARNERDELLAALIPLANASMPDERALISDEDQERAAALVAKMEPRDDDR